MSISDALASPFRHRRRRAAGTRRDAESFRAQPWGEVLECRQLLAMTAELAVDLNDQGLSAAPQELVDVSGTTFFVANDGIHGQELWQSDGTLAGTVLVKDIVPNAGGSFPTQLTNVSGTLFFRVGADLWKSEGSGTGTALVGSDLYPSELAASNGTLFFRGWTGADYELFKSDGSGAGTVLVKEIHPTASSNVQNLTDVSGTLFFTADDGAAGRELWKSDGTAAGTVLVKDIAPLASSSPTELTNLNGTLLFFADDATSGVELWKSDGTVSGTVMVQDLRTGSSGAFPAYLTRVGNEVFFRASGDTTTAALWRSDGTVGDVTLIQDGLYASQLAASNGQLFFRGWTGADYELYRSDGTAAGTVVVKDIHPTTGSSVADLTDVNGTLFFTAADGVAGRELWSSDGTAAGTQLVRDIHSGSSYPYALTASGGKLLFTAATPHEGRELWVSDGTPAGTALVRDIDPRTETANAANLAQLDGNLIFSADTPTGNGQLWNTDGTLTGTVLLRDNAYPSLFTEFNGALFFNGWTGSQYELFKTDGTPAGTVLVKDIDGANSSNPGKLTVVDGTLFFVATDTANGRELWMSDGTEAGTVFVKDIQPGNSSSYPDALTGVGGTLLFRANDGSNGEELWKSDGTTAGTVLVKDIRPGGPTYSSNPSYLVDLNGTLLFAATDDVTGRELWKSDGTTAGTVRVQDLLSTGSSGPQSLTRFGSHVLFRADGDVNASNQSGALWKTDGSLGGVALVADGVYPSELSESNGQLFFQGWTGSDYELFKTDGTTAGTLLVKDIQPLANYGSDPHKLTDVAGNLFFAADGGQGIELWQSDGTTAGTTLVRDIWPGISAYGTPYASTPAELIEAGGQLFFVADDGLHGVEVWKVPVANALPTVTLDVDAVSLAEAGGTATLTAQLSSPSLVDVTVNLSYGGLANGAGTDYTAATQIVIAAGDLTGTALITAISDSVYELDEAIVVAITTIANANEQGDQQATTTILNDDVLADFNGDTNVDALDVDAICAEVQAGGSDLAFDLNSDNMVLHSDFVFLVEDVLGTNLGDADLNGLVTASGDGGVLLSNLGQGGSQGWADGDFTCDGLVTASGDGAILLAGLNTDTAAAELAVAGPAVATAAAAEAQQVGANPQHPDPDAAPYRQPIWRRLWREAKIGESVDPTIQPADRPRHRRRLVERALQDGDIGRREFAALRAELLAQLAAGWRHRDGS